MENITEDGEFIGAGDLVQVEKDGEIHRGVMKMLNGQCYLGTYGSALRYYTNHGFDVSVLARAPKPVDARTVSQIVEWLGGHGDSGRILAALVAEKFGGVS